MKTALQKLQEDMQRQLGPLRQIQEMQDLVRRYSPEYQLNELMSQFGPQRQIQEVFERAVGPKHIQSILDGTSIAAQAQRMVERYLPTNAFAALGLDDESFRRASGLTFDSQAPSKAEGIDSIANIAKQYEQRLSPISQQQEWIEKLQRQAFGGLSVQDFARQLEEASPAFRAMEDAKKSLDRLWGQFRDIDFSQVEGNEADEHEAAEAARNITESATDQATFQEAVDRIVAAIQAQQKPAVQLMLWLFFRKIMDWLIAGAIGAAMGHYAPSVLGEAPQAAKKAVQQAARVAVGSPELLLEYRYVSAKLLIVRQSPRARSPEVARLTFGKPVKLLKKEKDFALVLWTDKDSGAEIQGWVFSRYLGKFTGARGRPAPSSLKKIEDGHRLAGQQETSFLEAMDAIPGGAGIEFEPPRSRVKFPDADLG
jgi:hypothetical protein